MVCKLGGLSGRHDSGAGGSRTGRRTRASHPMPRVVRLKRCARQPLVSARHFPHVRLPSSPCTPPASRSGRRGISPRVRVDTNGGSACPRPLTLPATTGGCGGVWEREHMLLPRFPGQRFRPPRVAIGCASQQCRAQEEQPSSARKPHHPRCTAREAGAAPLPGHLPSDALTATTVAPARHRPPRMNPHEMVRWRRGPRRREKRGVVFVLT